MIIWINMLRACPKISGTIVGISDHVCMGKEEISETSVRNLNAFPRFWMSGVVGCGLLRSGSLAMRQVSWLKPLASRELRLSWRIKTGLDQGLSSGANSNPGGGRKKLTEQERRCCRHWKLSGATTRGDPEIRYDDLLEYPSVVRSPSKARYRIGRQTVSTLLEELGYSLQGNQKRRKAPSPG